MKKKGRTRQVHRKINLYQSECDGAKRGFIEQIDAVS